MKASIGDILAIVPVAEKVSIADVCDCEEVYTGIAKDVPIGLKKWTVECICGHDGLGLSLYGAHLCMRECI